jgi:hypothetical protein
VKGRTAVIILGWVLGMLSGLLLAAPIYRHVGTSSELAPPPAQAAAAALPQTETGSHAFLQALPALCQNEGPAAGDGFSSFEDEGVVVWQQAHNGIKNATRLLPLARRLTLQALREAGAHGPINSDGLTAAKRRITAVNRVVLDPRLGNSGEVWDARPREIRIGPAYAMHLTSDDDALLLLAHELTHVATWSGRLEGFVNSLADKVRFTAGVAPTAAQKEDLACDFVAALAVKRFVELNPTAESKAERLSRVLGYESRDARLRFAWDEFCASYHGDYGDPGDAEHLSQEENLRALRGLDLELRTLVPGDSAAGRSSRERPSAGRDGRRRGRLEAGGRFYTRPHCQFYQ